MLELIYLGEEIYPRTSTMMSSLYEPITTREGSIYNFDYRRQDWGKVRISLENGEEVRIRPCNIKEWKILKTEADKLIDDYAYGRSYDPTNRWVYGLGNFKDGEHTPEEITEAVRKAKDF